MALEMGCIRRQLGEEEEEEEEGGEGGEGNWRRNGSALQRCVRLTPETKEQRNAVSVTTLISITGPHASFPLPPPPSPPPTKNPASRIRFLFPTFPEHLGEC